MRHWSETMSDWLVDYYALTTVVLVAAVVVMGRLRQPVRRLSVARSAVVGLAMLAVLAALPGWPRAYWRGRPGRTQPDRPAIAAASGQDSGIMTPAQLKTRPEPPDAMPTGPSLPAGRDDSIRAGRARAQPAVGTSVRISTVEWTSDWLGLVGGAYVAGGALVLAWLGIGLWQTARIRRQSRPAPQSSRDVLAHIVGDSRAEPDLLVSGWLAQPVAVGLLRPAIILPERFVKDEPRRRLEAALAHEWVHFRNRDLWWIALSGLLMPALFAHPMYWWLRRRAREDQELLADAAAADGRGDYAEALLAWARQTPDRLRLAAAGSLALWERPSQLKRRILMLLDRDFRLEPTCPRRWRLSVRGATALSVLALSVLTFRPAAVAIGADPVGPQAAREFGPTKDEAFESGATAKFLEPDGRRVGAEAGYRGLVPVRRMLGHTAGIGELVFSPDGRKALSCSADGTICLWEIDTGEQLRTLGGHRGAVQSVVFSRDGRRALSSGSDATVRYWDIDTGEELRRFEGHSGIVYSAVLAGDDRRVLSCGQDHTLRWWDAATGRQLQLLEVKNSPIRCVAVSHDDRLALSGGDDGIGRVWHLETGAELHRLEGHTAQIWHVAMSPDGQMGLTAGQDKMILMWDLRTGKLVRRFLGHVSDVNNLVFSPDGRRFLSASDDKTIRLWEVETGKELGRSTGHVSHVGAVAISPDGKLALTGGDDTCICLWQMRE
jgi:beta-lactamase regulating signal transducer with metallopeptidase domain